MKKFLILLIWFLTVTLVYAPDAEPPPACLEVPADKYKPAAKELIVTFIDVGQGDSIFIKMPNGKTVLLDSGGTPHWRDSDYDPGKAVVLPYLKKRKIKRLDYVITSHGHGDHIAGMIAVLEEIPTGIIYENGFDSEDPDYETLHEFIDEQKIPTGVLRRGTTLCIDPSVKLEILSPPENFYFGDDNTNSIVIRLVYGDVSFLFTGDIEAEAEDDIVHTYGIDIESNVLKIAHHGSATSTNEGFLYNVNPEIAVICVGKYNNFGHPTAGVLANLKYDEIGIYRTDRNGDITFTTDGKKFKIESEKSEDEGWD